MVLRKARVGKGPEKGWDGSGEMVGNGIGPEKGLGWVHGKGWDGSIERVGMVLRKARVGMGPEKGWNGWDISMQNSIHFIRF